MATKASQSVLIAIIGVIGSLGAAWITAGQKFDRELAAKSTQIESISSRVDLLKQELSSVPDTAAKLSRIGDQLNRLSGQAEQEARTGFTRSATGTKACVVSWPSRWIDVVTVPRSATAQACETLRDYEDSGSRNGTYHLACIFVDRIRIGEGSSPPSPNCGW